MKFTLEIELDGDTMQTYGDIAARLREVANYIRSYRGRDETQEVNDNAPIRDINGNVVGKWEVIETPKISPASIPHAFSQNDIETNACSVCGKSLRWKNHNDL